MRFWCALNKINFAWSISALVSASLVTCTRKISISVADISAVSIIGTPRSSCIYGTTIYTEINFYGTHIAMYTFWVQYKLKKVAYFI